MGRGRGSGVKLPFKAASSHRDMGTSRKVKQKMNEEEEAVFEAESRQGGMKTHTSSGGSCGVGACVSVGKKHSGGSRRNGSFRSATSHFVTDCKQLT